MRLCSIILLSLISPRCCGDITKLIIDTDMVGYLILPPTRADSILLCRTLMWTMLERCVWHIT